MGILDWLRPRARAAPQASPAPAAPLPPAPPVKAALPRPGAPLLALGAMSPADRRTALLRGVVDPTLAWLADMSVPSDDRARVILLAIAGQEADCMHRRQIPVAHAMGLWQFERGGGVAGVLSHRASMLIAGRVCVARNVRANSTDVHMALAHDDVLACALARLLLWTDARPLPGVHAEDEAWAYYLRNWRPGAYDRGTDEERAKLRAKWAGHHRMARDAVGIR